MSDSQQKSKEIRNSIQTIKKHSEEIISEKKEQLTNDITNLKISLQAMEATLKFARENAQRNSILLSNISHTLRTNLNDILGFSSLLGSDFAMNEEEDLYGFSENIRKSGESLLHLLNNIIDISRIEAKTFDLNWQNCNLVELVKELISEFEPKARQKGLQIFFQDEPIPLFSTDVQALKHIISNLLDNAVKYTDKGFIKLIQKTEDKEVVLSVKDTGIGIDKAFLKDIFEPFRPHSLGYTKTTYQGAGLGLPLARQMLDMMGGSIEIQSEKTLGSTVTIYIPLTPALPDQKDEVPTAQADIKKEKPIKLVKRLGHILIVDSDYLNNMLIKKMMADVHHLSFAVTEEELIAVINEAVKTKNLFDIIIINTDFKTENGGVRLFKKLKETYPDLQKTPFIALFDVFEIGKDMKMLKIGFKAYLNKPIIKEKLFNSVNTSIG